MIDGKQLSLAGGEISPDLHARIDLAKYMNGLRTMRNCYVKKGGSAVNRPGTQFVAEIKDSAKAARIVPFVYSDSTSEQNSVVEVGEGYYRWHKEGAQVRENGINISAITAANPPVVTTATHSYTTGQEVYLSGILGMVELNGRNFKITVLSSTTFSLQSMAGANVNATTYTAYSSAGTSKRVYTLTNSYVEADLFDLYFAQSLTEMTITHPSYAPVNLTRAFDTSWSAPATSFEPSISRPTTTAGTAGAAGTNTYRYRVTAFLDGTNEESWHSLDAALTITGASQANPCVITIGAGHTYTTGDEIYVTGITTMTQLNGKKYVITYVNGTTFQLQGINSTAYTAYGAGGGTSTRTHRTIPLAADPTQAAPNVLTWTAPATGTAREYSVFREYGGVYGFIGTTISTSFSDTGITPDTSESPDSDYLGSDAPFDETNEYPSVVSYYQQRRMLANTNEDPETVLASQVGYYRKFTTHIPLISSDGVSFRLSGQRINEVRHVVDMGTVLGLFTSGGEWACRGNEAGTLTPFDINAKQYGFHGCSKVPPIQIDGQTVFVQSRGSEVRTFSYNVSDDGFGGDDLTIFASHLFEGYEIVDWAYQSTPTPVIWAVRSDGTLLSLTYIRGQDVMAWARHDFQGGEVESVAVVPGDLRDDVYLVIKRAIDSRSVRYIERLTGRYVDPDATEDMIFMDSTLTYDGWNAAGTTATLSGGTTWDYPEEVTLTMNASTFTSAAYDVGNEIHYRHTDGETYRWEITGYTSPTVVTVRLDRLLPAALRGTALTGWGYANDEVRGLIHIAGEDVSVLGDGRVAASPNNVDYTTVTVSALGVVTLDRPYVMIHVGLPYLSDLETLDLVNNPRQETSAARGKQTTSVGLHLEKSRGIWAGPKPPSDDDDDPIEGLVEFKLQEHVDYDQENDLFSGVDESAIEGEWNTNGRIFLRQIDPVPMSVLAIYAGGYK